MQSRDALLRAYRSFATKAALQQFLEFGKGREVARTLNLKSQQDWIDLCSRGEKPLGLPSRPSVFYAGRGWDGFPDWLGYQRQAAVRKPPSAVHARRLAQVVAKEIVLSRSASFFEMECLPQRSAAQVLYRPSGYARWCALVLRSNKDAHQGFVFFEMPKLTGLGGTGLVFVLQGQRRIFFLPSYWLYARNRNKAAQPSGDSSTTKCCVKLKDILDFEVSSDGALREVLQQHYDASTLLAEADLTTTVYSTREDRLLQHLSHLSLSFLKEHCGLHIRRPGVKDALETPYVLGKQTILIRCGVPRSVRPSWRVRLGYWRKDDAETKPPVHAASKDDAVCAWERCPDYLIVLLRKSANERPQCPTDEQLAGFFIFPRAYLRDSGKLVSESRGVSGLHVFPPWVAVARFDGRKHQRKQLEFFIDCSPAMAVDKSIQIQKARNIFSNHGAHVP